MNWHSCSLKAFKACTYHHILQQVSPNYGSEVCMYLKHLCSAFSTRKATIISQGYFPIPPEDTRDWIWVLHVTQVIYYWATTLKVEQKKTEVFVNRGLMQAHAVIVNCVISHLHVQGLEELCCKRSNSEREVFGKGQKCSVWKESVAPSTDSCACRTAHRGASF